ncbi:CLAVATA3/ESR (CLE)-related protein 25 isoform X1 [Diospyros lotus]|uniref:CLAVATA3/ESR (CLE)-related protein 25 isoform X1 n=1 Tax=Diospyros lotus TaxID=55363 RepID=UPI00225220D0|nr:CLAVATA3/ESR (CLE)-related protein 25 isoform X1 [Diospyros lotus]
MGARGRVSMIASVAIVLFMGFVWFLFVAVAASRMTTRTALTAQSTKKAELLKLIETEKEAVRDWDLDPYSASNRKVPNGPDPIHNRRAGKFREPPGRV